MITRHDPLAPNPGVGLAHLSASASASRPQEWLINQLSRLSRFNDDRERSAVHAQPAFHASVRLPQTEGISLFMFDCIGIFVHSTYAWMGIMPLLIACVHRVHEDAHTIEHIKRCHLLRQAAGGFVQMHKKS